MHYLLQKMCIAKVINGKHTNYQKISEGFKQYLIGKHTQKNLKKNGMHILIMNLSNAKKAIGFAIKAMILILLALIICTCNGPRLMLGDQNLGKQIDYSLFTGKHVRQTRDVTEFVTSKIDGLDLALCHRLKQLTKPRSLQIVGLGYYQKLEQMQKKCLPTKSFLYQPTIRFL